LIFSASATDEPPYFLYDQRHRVSNLHERARLRQASARLSRRRRGAARLAERDLLAEQEEPAEQVIGTIALAW